MRPLQWLGAGLLVGGIAFMGGMVVRGVVGGKHEMLNSEVAGWYRALPERDREAIQLSCSDGKFPHQVFSSCAGPECPRWTCKDILGR